MRRLLSCLLAIGLSACGATELRSGLPRPPRLSNGDGGPTDAGPGDAGAKWGKASICRDPLDEGSADR